MADVKKQRSLDTIAGPPRRVTIPVATTPVAATEPQAEVTSEDTYIATETEPSEPNIKRTWRPGKRFWMCGAILLVACGVIFAGLAFAHSIKRTPVATKQVMRTPTPTPTPIPPTYDVLTGLNVDPAAANLPVMGVMIENFYPDARPQSGLSQAGVVYEALAEGGITRFLAIFQQPMPGTIGPVRSLRPYYLDWGLEYGIPVAHAGGSQPALAEIRPLGMKDINALAYDGNYFTRSRDRYAPHNLYTTGTLLAKLTSVLGFDGAPTFTPLPRKADAPMTTPTHTDIKINFSYADYAAEYKYDQANDVYDRFEGGTPQIDRNTGKQITVKNVVVELVPTTYSTQPDGKPETDYALIGHGQALVFEDGGVTAATWSKTSDASPTTLQDASGAPIMFNRGNTWYSVATTSTPVTY